MTEETEGRGETALPRETALPAEAESAAAVNPEAEGRIAVERFSYRLFIGYVSLNALVVLLAYSLLPLSQPVREVLGIIDGLNAAIFLVDFLIQLITSDNKMRYFFRAGGWLDLLGCLPLHPWFRFFRIIRSIRLWRRLARTTPVEIRLAAHRRLAESSLFVVASMVLLVVTAGSVALAAIEPRAAGATIRRGSDAVWFVFTTIATVGYGDTYPVTDAGRFVGVMLMIAGVSAFSVLTSYIASTFMSRGRNT